MVFQKVRQSQVKLIQDCTIRENFKKQGIVVKKDHFENYFEQKNRRKDIGVFLVDINNLDLNNKLNLGSSGMF